MLRFVQRILVASLGIIIISGSLYGQVNSEPAYKIARAVNWIQSYYVDSVDAEKMVDHAIVDMLKELDPHSNYLTKEEVKEMNEPLQGNFEGIGVSFNILNDTIIVIKPLAGGPSEKAGVKAGDKIIMINAQNVAGTKITNDGVFDRLRGAEGSTVTISVKRQGEASLLDYKLTRGKIPIYSLEAAYMISNGVGYIKLNRFAATTSKEFQSAFENLKKQKANSLILDLSDNGGGYLEEATKIADFLLPANRLIVYTQGVNSKKTDYLSTSYGAFEKGNLVVVVDEGSASASEILAGAIQDWDRGILVGRRTFGKGLVQRPMWLPDQSMIRLTIARYYTPTGRCIQKPYTNGMEEYEKEILKRYQHGELIHSDSINFPDSLRFLTLTKNRSVYGGGGIMPDIFVPLDTTSYSDYYRQLLSKGILNKFILTYLDQNRRSLNKLYPDFKTYNANFVVSEEFLNQLIEFAKNEKLEPVEKDIQVSRAQIVMLLKAYLARDIWDSSEFYQVFNKDDNTILKALQVISNMNNYW
jgi:carboxyl-terminal processing protease